VSRNQVVRERFDPLEQAFMAQAAQVAEQAAGLIDQDGSAAAKLLDAFTAECLQATTAALKDLLARFDSEG
jgi:hypothetical protein